MNIEHSPPKKFPIQFQLEKEQLEKFFLLTNQGGSVESGRSEGSHYRSSLWSNVSRGTSLESHSWLGDLLTRWTSWLRRWGWGQGRVAVEVMSSLWSYVTMCFLTRSVWLNNEVTFITVMGRAKKSNKKIYILV